MSKAAASSKTNAIRLAPADIAALSATGTRYEVPTEKGHPLWVRVEARGSKNFIVRTRVAGKSVRKGIGPVLQWTLTEAKRKAREMDEDARENAGKVYFADSAATRSTVGAQTDTVEWAWNRYMANEGSLLVSAAEKLTFWTRDIQPAWGDRRLASVTKQDCVTLRDACLDRARARKETGTSANNLIKTIKRFFNWCEGEGYIDANPAAKLKKPINVRLTRRPSRALNEQELRWLFQALDQHAGRRAEGVEMLLRSVCRLANIFTSKWENVSEAGLLIERTKNGTPFMLPLTDSMKSLMGERGTRQIFPGNITWQARLIEDLRRTMDEIAREDGFNGTFVPEFFEDGSRNQYYWSAHDFRDTATMWLKFQRYAQTGMPLYPAEIREAMLNHRSSSVEATHYNNDAGDPFWFYSERKVTGAAWNAFLDGVKAEALRVPR